MGLGVNQVVHLEKVDVADSKVLKGLGYLLFTGLFTFDSHLGRQIKLVPFALNRDPDGFLRRAVHRRRVDEVDVIGQQIVDYLTTLRQVGFIGNIERPQSSQADHRDIQIA